MSVTEVEEADAIIDPLEAMLGYELRRASAAVMNTVAAALEPLDLRWSEASMLMMLGANPGCTQSEVARTLRVQAANLVPIINRLELLGALKRTPKARRAIALVLTKQGDTLLKQVKQIMAQHEERLGRGLSKETQAKL